MDREVRAWLLLRRTRVQFPAPTSEGSQPPGTVALEHLTLLPVSSNTLGGKGGRGREKGEGGGEGKGRKGGREGREGGKVKKFKLGQTQPLLRSICPHESPSWFILIFSVLAFSTWIYYPEITLLSFIFTHTYSRCKYILYTNRILKSTTENLTFYGM